MPLTPQFVSQLDRFCDMVRDQTHARLKEQKLDCEANKVKVYPEYGRKYIRIVFHHGNGEGQRMCRYFVSQEDGTIFACDSWKSPNLKRSYGTLDTVDQFDWGGYNGMAKPGSDYGMVSTNGHYSTAVKLQRDLNI